MKLTELARQLDTTPVTVYRRLKRAGIRIETLRDDNTGDLTPAGVQTIAALYDAPGPVAADQDGVSGHITDAYQSVSPDTCQGGSPVSGPDAVPAAVLAARLEGAQALIEQLQGERDDLRRQLAAALAALQREQDDRQQERRLLTDGRGGDDPRPRWRWPWARRR